jgi:GT2 family glycosyltransferase
VDLKNYCSCLSWTNYIRSPNNLGYFGGLNLGIEHTDIDTQDFIIICNNDLEFESYFCEKLLNSKYPNDVFAVCPDIITKDGIHQNPHRLKKMSYFKRLQFDAYFSHYFIGIALPSIKNFIKNITNKVQTKHIKPLRSCEVNEGVGACYILLPSFFQHIDKLYFPWFLYGEEVCLSWQIHDKRGILWFDPDLKITHDESATLSKLPKRITYEFARTSYWGYRHLI